MGKKVVSVECCDRCDKHFVPGTEGNIVGWTLRMEAATGVVSGFEALGAEPWYLGERGYEDRDKAPVVPLVDGAELDSANPPEMSRIKLAFDELCPECFGECLEAMNVVLGPKRQPLALPRVRDGAPKKRRSRAEPAPADPTPPQESGSETLVLIPAAEALNGPQKFDVVPDGGVPPAVPPAPDLAPSPVAPVGQIPAGPKPGVMDEINAINADLDRRVAEARSKAEARARNKAAAKATTWTPIAEDAEFKDKKTVVEDQRVPEVASKVDAEASANKPDAGPMIAGGPSCESGSPDAVEVGGESLGLSRLRAIVRGGGKLTKTPFGLPEGG